MKVRLHKFLFIHAGVVSVIDILIVYRLPEFPFLSESLRNKPDTRGSNANVITRVATTFKFNPSTYAPKIHTTACIRSE